MFIKLFLIVALIPLQSCSNTIIGQDLSDSFDSPVQNNVSQEKSLKNNNSLSQSKFKESTSASLYPKRFEIIPLFKSKGLKLCFKILG